MQISRAVFAAQPSLMVNFWLTRNHHGCGFWDGDWDNEEFEAGAKLTKIANNFAEVNLYFGDDGKIYLE